jgi:simple sugar transport system ATP-binding protein
MSSTQAAGAHDTSAANAPFVLEARDISKRYGPTTALAGVDLQISPGESRALVGRNGAGKSTLVSILTGLQAPDTGVVKYNGSPAPSLGDRAGWQKNVACVYQHSAIIPTLSVGENLFLNRQTSTNGIIRWKNVRKQAQDLLDSWEIGVDADTIAGELGVEAKQMVEIARALSFGARFIILDEPTAQLDARGIARLFDRLRAVSASGVSILFISHHLEEVYEICESVSVFRDARHIVTSSVADLPRRDLVAAMTGDAIEARDAGARLSTARLGESLLSVRGLGLKDTYENVSFDIAPGEVVGITGSASSGRLGVAESIVGLRRADEGDVVMNGRPVSPGSVPAAFEAGIGFVPRDRHEQGYVPGLGVGENMTSTVSHRFGRAGFMNLNKRDEYARTLMKKLSVVASGPEQEVSSLSGGNQQKVVMGRALADDPDLLVLMHPTAGVDIRSKEVLIDVVDDVRRDGTGVLIVSDELEDLRPCDRVLVMLHGRVVQEFARGWSDQEVVAAVEGVTTHV